MPESRPPCGRRRPDQPPDHRPRHPGSTIVRIRLGPVPITLPGPVADLTRQLLNRKRGHATTGAGTPHPGCSPEASPAARSAPPTSGNASKTSAPSPARHAPPRCSKLAAELPAALLARMLGIHIDVAVAWQYASAGD